VLLADPQGFPWLMRFQDGVAALPQSASSRHAHHLLVFDQQNGPLASRQVVAFRQLLIQVPCRVPLPHGARNLGGRDLLFYPVRPVTMPVVFLVRRAFTLGPLIRLGWGAIFGPLVW
jgi:hypothetical protein